MRTLARAAKTQRSALAKLLDSYATPPEKRARKAAPRKSPSTPPNVQASPPEPRRRQPSGSSAPGQWLAGRYPLPILPGHAVVRHMRYWLYVPKHVPDTVARHGWPLVVMLHGCQQSATQFAQGTRMNQLAEDKGYAVLYPQQPMSVHAQRCWRWYERSTQQGGGETIALAALIGRVCEDHGIDRRRIYACGLSAGAGMAAVLALNHPALIAAVGLHSGPVFGVGHTPMGALHVMRHGAAAQFDAAILGVLHRRAEQAAPGVPEPMPLIPALLIQGDDDQAVRPINQQQLTRQWLQLHGLPDGPATRVTVKPAGRGGRRNAHEIHDYLMGRKVMLRVVRIAGLGHAWSGGDPTLRFNAQAGPEASRMMLEFLGKHRRQTRRG
ncbi:extracellular catalytic domain type 1 short-chain-length polyhydroxyalkanoate depolymerase [Massilia putida]|uniref:extracellular catalytic domain type 1 short-chain-length polyhydroxyalkanoate depolymerase n=1 Tax=Massilia putida TaxID=1141883 RepID=UPI001E50308A|nr:PHB depolymerase family esterase [Massilia putida]